MFIPTTREELQKLGWENPDIILVTGDSYIDSPFIGVAIIGKVLIDAGYKVAIRDSETATQFGQAAFTAHGDGNGARSSLLPTRSTVACGKSASLSASSAAAPPTSPLLTYSTSLCSGEMLYRSGSS